MVIADWTPGGRAHGRLNSARLCARTRAARTTRTSTGGAISGARGTTGTSSASGVLVLLVALVAPQSMKPERAPQTVVVANLGWRQFIQL